jgi:hypothetical protein
MMIAEALPAPDPRFVWELILVLGSLASIGANIATALSVRRTQRREVSFQFTPASKEEFERHVASNKQEHENLFSKIGGVERGSTARLDEFSKEWRGALSMQTSEIKLSAEQRQTVLHNRITDVLGEVRELRGEVNGMNHSK